MSATRPRSKPCSSASPGGFFAVPGYDGWPLVLLRLAEVTSSA
jgi:hypothetical protein